MCISFLVDTNHEDISPQRNMHTQNRYKVREHDIQEEVINTPIRSLLKSIAQNSILSWRDVDELPTHTHHSIKNIHKGWGDKWDAPRKITSIAQGKWFWKASKLHMWDIE